MDGVKISDAKETDWEAGFILDLLFALPSSDSDSDVEPDDGASEELLHLHTTDHSGQASPDPRQP